MSLEKNIAINVKNLTKVYRIYKNPLDRLLEVLNFSKKSYGTNHLVLNDISFDIHKGEFVGILGKNGAGKSTLLRILTKELLPTGGEVLINGTVSLLQLGTGFNPELSGKENAIFSCRVLGYTEEQIEKIVQNVIEFSELGDYIYQPLKTYSSGMYSRLSFSVAINIDPDILIIDEVLSVGDVRFSQKCLKKMHELKNTGKTILLVTHSVETVKLFCDRAMWIKDGKIFEFGNAKEVAANFYAWMIYNKLPVKEVPKISIDGEKNQATIQPHSVQYGPPINFPDEWEIDSKELEWIDLRNVKTHGSVHKGGMVIEYIALYDLQQRKTPTTILPGSELVLLTSTYFETSIERPNVGWTITDRNALVALYSNSRLFEERIDSNFKDGERLLTFHRFKFPYFNKGKFLLSVGCGSHEELLHRVCDVLVIDVDVISKNSEMSGYLLIEEQDFFSTRHI